MAERLVRAEVLLEAEQREKLAEMAAREGRSLSAVVRQIVQQELDRRAEVGSGRRRSLANLDQIRKQREEMLARRGGVPLQVDLSALIDEMREERDEEILANLRPPRR